MTIAKREMFKRYFLGQKSGKASREKIEEINGYLSIVGYGWAIYVIRYKNEYLLFGDGYKTQNTDVGWSGYSGQTTQHMQEIKGLLEENDYNYTVVDYPLRKLELRSKEIPEVFLKNLKKEHSVEKRKGKGYTVTL